MEKAFDVSKVKNLSTSTAAGKAIFDILGQRERSTKQLDLGRLYRSLKHNNIFLSKEEFFDVFRELERLNVGEIIMGRRKRPLRFHWTKAKLLDVVDAIKEGTIVAQREHEIKEEISPQTTSEQPASFVIRKGATEFEVPMDVSNKQLIKIAKLLRRLS